eukprot:GABV01001469.1.p1 GENE.GABV01001469.1~~GABV01001469.1.p1  ORF type:complete len:220 (+),score=53.60 GABV01001469.1:225-884(+)
MNQIVRLATDWDSMSARERTAYIATKVPELIAIMFPWLPPPIPGQPWTPFPGFPPIDWPDVPSDPDLLQVNDPEDENLRETGRNIRNFLGERWLWGNLYAGGRLYFAPNTPAVADVVEYLNTSYTAFKYLYEGIFESEQAAVDFAFQEHKPFEGCLGVISFDKLDLSVPQIDYAIRMIIRRCPAREGWWSIQWSCVRGFDAVSTIFYSGFVRSIGVHGM